MANAQIEQLQRMFEADPNNELAAFSLGRALVEEKRYSEAIQYLQRATEVNPGMSKAYHLLALSKMQAGDRTGAMQSARAGYSVADQRGDIMPRDALARLLQQLGDQSVAQSPADLGSGAARKTEIGPGQIQCSRCGRPEAQMAEPPFRGPLGEQVRQNVCGDCWQQWIRLGTKVINEMRLDLSDPADAEIYDRHMVEFLNIEAPR